MQFVLSVKFASYFNLIADIFQFDFFIDEKVKLFFRFDGVVLSSRRKWPALVDDINWRASEMLSVLNRNGINLINCFFHVSEWHPLE